MRQVKLVKELFTKHPGEGSTEVRNPLLERLSEFLSKTEREEVVDYEFSFDYNDEFVAEENTVEFKNTYFSDSDVLRQAVKLKDCFIREVRFEDVYYLDQDVNRDCADEHTMSTIKDSIIYDTKVIENNFNITCNTRTLSISSSEIYNSEFNNVIFKNCELNNCTLKNCELINCHIAQSTIDTCDLDESIISQTAFENTSCDYEMYPNSVNNSILIACDVQYTDVKKSRASLCCSYMSNFEECDWENGEIYDREVGDYVVTDLSPEFYTNSDQNYDGGLEEWEC